MDREKSAYTEDKIYAGDIVFTSIYIDYYYTHAYPKKDSDSIVFYGNKKSENKNVYSHRRSNKAYGYRVEVYV